MSRRPYIAGNWKMNKTGFEAEDFVFALLPQIAGDDIAEVVICAPFTALSNVIDSSRGTRIKVAAQNMHEAESGAFTGEVSAGMLRDIDVRAVVLGHSERRQYFNETDEALAAKVVVALENDLEPILCVGETDAQREANETEAVLKTQVETALANVPAEKLGDVVIAYEPVWAIGTGKTATNELAQEACAFIRSLLDPGAADKVRILYGGSMKPENAAELLAQPDIDGGLIGGASLKADDFAALVAAGDAAA
ncbi:MAG: triose-phosphate isomerase [Thermoleophilaceae bacterium]|nr:triose-phosphate isomerase [Thermoleophilaceae bacterium]